MIEDKFEIIKDAEMKLDSAKRIVEKHSECFDLCEKYVKIWNNNDSRCADLSISDIYSGVNLHLSLDKNGTQKDIDLFIEEIEEKESLKHIKTEEYPSGKWIRYHFKKNDADIHIFFNYEKSEYCKLVETGEYTPIFKRVCI